jgi:NH3-dependent NAD+ synthetase
MADEVHDLLVCKGLRGGWDSSLAKTYAQRFVGRDPQPYLIFGQSSMTAIAAL